MSEKSIDSVHQEYLSAFRQVRMPGLEEFETDKLLFNQSYHALTRKWKFLLGTVVAALFFDRETIRYDDREAGLLLYSEVFNRKDHDTYWQLLCDLFPDKNTMTIVNLSKSEMKRCLRLGQIPGKLKRLAQYNKRLKFVRSRLQRAFLSAQLIWLYQFLKKIEKLQLHPKAAMCFCDADFHETLLVQWLNHRGVATVTNQHGQPLLRDKNTDRLNQSQALNFNSRYFLAKGSFTREQFRKAGVSDDRVIVVGDLKHEKPAVAIHEKKNRFCVFLDTPSYGFAEKTNAELLRFAEAVGGALHMDYYVKLHPSDDSGRYSGVSPDRFLDRNISLSECFGMIDFGLFSASAIYIDMIAFGVKAYQYCGIPFPITSSEDDRVASLEDFTEKHRRWEAKNDGEKRAYFAELYGRYYSDKNAADEIRMFVGHLLTDGGEQ